jgi:hypothetical protein
MVSYFYTFLKKYLSVDFSKWLDRFCRVWSSLVELEKLYMVPLGWSIKTQLFKSYGL